MLNADIYFDRLIEIIQCPGMFKIQRVEDISLIILAERMINKNGPVDQWDTDFPAFVTQQMNKDLKNFHWSHLIRLYSGSDSYSIQLFKEMYQPFQLSKRITAV